MGNCFDEDGDIKAPSENHGNNGPSFFQSIQNAAQELQQAFNEGYDQGLKKGNKKKQKKQNNGNKNQENDEDLQLKPQANQPIYGQPGNVKSYASARPPAKKLAEGETPSQKMLLYEIQDLLMKRELEAVLPKDFFVFIYEMYTTQYWTTDARELLLKQLISYIKFNVSLISSNEKNQTSYTLENFHEKFGKDIYKIFNEIKMKNTWMLKSLLYFPTFIAKKFALKEHEEVVRMAGEVKAQCSNSSAALIYLSSYFVLCCRKLQKQGKTVTQINELLKPEVIKIKEMFSPKSKLEEEMKYNKRSFEEKQLKRIPSKDEKYVNKTLVFVQGKSKEEQLGDLIMEMVELGKKHYSSFTELTSSCCLQNEGFAYKSNLKLKERSQQMPLLRVKEKLLKDKVGEMYKDKKYDCKTIGELRKAEVEYLQSALNQVYSKMDKVEFTVSDILRGKCMFNKIVNINDAAENIIQKVKERASKGEDIQIVQVDNRLGKITTDLVLKIRMEQIACEFQLALKFNQAENEIHHKMYEVERSKVFTPVTMLFTWHDAISSDYFTNLDRILKQSTRSDSKTYTKKRDQLLKFIEFSQQIKPASESESSKQDYQFLLKIKQQVSSLKVPKQLIANANLRAGKTLKFMKKYKQAIIALSVHHQQNPKDHETYLQLGEVYRLNGQHLKGIEYYNSYLQLKADKQEPDPSELSQYFLVATQLAECMWEVGKDKQALELLTQFQTTQMNKYFSQQCKQRASIWSDIGRVYKKLAKGKQALQYLQKSTKLFEKLKTSAEDPNYPDVYRRLAEYYFEESQYAKALQYLNKAQSISENMFGKESLQAIQCDSVTGRIYSAMGKYDEAEQYYKKYLILSQNLMTSESMQYAAGLFLLADVFREKGEHKKALKALNQCQKIVVRVTGQNSKQHMQVYNNYGLFYFATGDLQKARQAFQKCVQILTKLGNQLTPNMSVMYGNLAMIHQNSNQFEIAKEYYMKQAQLYDKLYGEQNVKICSLLNNIGTLVMQQNKFKQAQQVFLQAVGIFDKNNIDNDPFYIMTLANLGQLYSMMLDKTKALEYFNKALKLYEVTVGKSNDKYKTVLEQIKNIDKSISIYRNPNWRQLVAQHQAQQQQQQKVNNNNNKKSKNDDQDDDDDDDDQEDFGTQLWNFIVD